MKIKVIGKNSSNRIKLVKNLNKAVKDVDLFPDIEIIDSEGDLKKYQSIATPILMINNKIVSNGKILTDREIKHYIKLLA